MTRRPGRSLVALVVGAVSAGSPGCSDTEECRKLRAVKASAERALHAAKGRAALAERTRSSLDRVKASTEAKLEAHGLDLAEAEIVSTLEARAETVEGARFEREVRTQPVDPRSDSPRETTSETIFGFTFPARNVADAWEKARSLMASPPLTRLVALLAPREQGEPWRLELGRADVQRLPMRVEPRPLPPRPAADEVEPELGFCGASALRDEIEAIEAEIAKHAEAAEATTVHLPLSASWRGLSRRVDLAVESETETRRLAELLVDAAVKGRARFVGLGAEAEAVLLEIRGGAKELGRVQAQLGSEVLSGLREIPEAREGVARLALGNRVAAAGRRPDRGGVEAHPEPRYPGRSRAPGGSFGRE